MTGWSLKRIYLHVGLRCAVAAFAADEFARTRTASIHLAALRGLAVDR